MSGQADAVVPGEERCFACDRPMPERMRMNNATTKDGQCVQVGAECLRHVKKAGEAGYQPPLGGPRLYPIGRAS